MTTHVDDPALEAGTRLQHGPHNVGREADMDLIDIKQIAQRLFRGLLRIDIGLGNWLIVGGKIDKLVGHEGGGAQNDRAQDERQERQPGDKGKQCHERGNSAQRTRIATQLLHHCPVSRPLLATF